ncbi:MAG: isocitrate/isopropylmalate family dehydrogenase, partial [Gemmataceae bacterium]
NVGDGVKVYEAVYGAGAETVSPDTGNPLPLVMPTIELLKDLGETIAATRLLTAVENVLSAGRVLPRDLGGQAGTKAITDAILAELATIG